MAKRRKKKEFSLRDILKDDKSDQFNPQSRTSTRGSSRRTRMERYPKQKDYGRKNQRVDEYSINLSIQNKPKRGNMSNFERNANENQRRTRNNRGRSNPKLIRGSTKKGVNNRALGNNNNRQTGNRSSRKKKRRQKHHGRHPNDGNMEKKVNQPVKEEDLFKNYSVGINFDNYDDIPVRVKGKNVPKVIDNLGRMVFPKALQDNIKRARYTKLTPVQKHCIPIGLAKRDVMACAETGSGKTAGFLFPIISMLLSGGVRTDKSKSVREPEALILAPTRELAQQIEVEALKFTYKSGLKVLAVFGGKKMHTQEPYLPGTNILIATPGRLNDMLNQEFVSLRRLAFFVLDEGDRMLDMGFIPQVKDIVRRMPAKSQVPRQIMMFSATFPQDMRTMANQFMARDYLFVSVGRIGTTANVEQSVFFVEKPDKLARILDLIKSEPYSKMLVFLKMTSRVDRLYKRLTKKGIKCGRIHGRRSQNQRESALKAIKEGAVNILLCTDVLARGIDIGDIKYVVNYEMPRTIADYTHRVGRTGRVGNKGFAVSYFSDEDDIGKKGIAKDLLKELQENDQEVPDWLRARAKNNKRK